MIGVISIISPVTPSLFTWCLTIPLLVSTTSWSLSWLVMERLVLNWLRRSLVLLACALHQRLTRWSVYGWRRSFGLLSARLQSLSFDAFEWWLSYFVDLFEAYEQVKSTTLSQPLISVVMRAVMRMYFVDTFTETEEIVVPDSELDNIDFILNMINRHKVTRQLDENIINV